ncbi:MAG: DUF4982 domain-containing protein [Bacteroidales bacterium]|nr:DUF4982 domain-containing protein [Bacteroidales bacterium]
MAIVDRAWLRKAVVGMVIMLTGLVNCMARETVNFNGGWLLHVGDAEGLEKVSVDDSGWRRVTLPRAFNEDEAFAVAIHHLSDTVVWYRKHFHLTDCKTKKTFLELEGVRQAAMVYVNGILVGETENGITASGYDLTTALRDGENVIAIRVDNDWQYHEKASGSRYQWNDKNFNVNYGGITKNTFLHMMPMLYQTLPLYSNLKTRGIYVYATDYDIAGKTATVHVESQMRNESETQKVVRLKSELLDAEGTSIGSFTSEPHAIMPGRTVTLKSEHKFSGLHFWSWGYGYLYTARTSIVDDDGQESDAVETRTGFRKTEFKDGKIYLNDRVIMVHGYAQRTTNEWPSVGIDIPAWLSDYSNGLMVESGGNLIRWMHVAPSRQDVESCDRVGMMQAMPAGDAEKDVDDRRWEQRKAVMRDAINYFKNNPSIIFYECGNKGISAQHMEEMKPIRDDYDPHGGRAIGCREMLDDDLAEYGGEMLYVNKSAGKPMWMMEYCRDEGLRKYWDEWTPPYHKHGDGPTYRGKPASEYNQNMDMFAVKMVDAWYDYYLERPGTGRRVNSGGAKIIFSDTNTHFRGESNYRTSGVVDAMRIAKDAFYAHRVMWNGWVDPEEEGTHIVGHWNYEDGVSKPVYVISTADEVELYLNGKTLGKGRQSSCYLFTFDKVSYVPGTLIAKGYKGGRVVTTDTIETVGKPHHIRLHTIQNPQGMKADGADLALIEFEIVDKDGRRCPTAFTDVTFTTTGPCEWRGGIATRKGAYSSSEQKEAGKVGKKEAGLLDSSDANNNFDNYILAKTLPAECGVNRVFVRSTTTPGKIVVKATAKGLKGAQIELTAEKVDIENYNPRMTLPCALTRGETPSTPSIMPSIEEIEIAGTTAGSNAEKVVCSYDDNEATEWTSDGTKENAWVTYRFARPSDLAEVVLKPTGWRTKYYPLEILVDGKSVWKGMTYPTLGYVHIALQNIAKGAKEVTLKMLGPSTERRQESDQAELAGGVANELDRLSSAKGKVELRIVEIGFKTENKE